MHEHTQGLLTQQAKCAACDHFPAVAQELGYNPFFRHGAMRQELTEAWLMQGQPEAQTETEHLSWHLHRYRYIPTRAEEQLVYRLGINSATFTKLEEKRLAMQLEQCLLLGKGPP